MEVLLADLEVGKKAQISRIEGGRGFRRKIASLGIRVGKTIRKISAQPLRGPVVVEVDRTRIALGRGMAKRISVEEVK